MSRQEIRRKTTILQVCCNEILNFEFIFGKFKSDSEEWGEKVDKFEGEFFCEGFSVVKLDFEP